ncbi:DNA-binding protein [Candidatus Woesearchaeota archaeon]|nr:DNA-binding protein [Candidatus Woesearchaeota archaeon]
MGDKIKDLQPKQGKIILHADVIEVSNAKEFTKFGKIGRVANATIKDDTGKIKLTLWNDEIDKIKAGSKIKIQNGYVNEWQGEKQITAGRFGSIDLI